RPAGSPPRRWSALQPLFYPTASGFTLFLLFCFWTAPAEQAVAVGRVERCCGEKIRAQERSEAPGRPGDTRVCASARAPSQQDPPGRGHCTQQRAAQKWKPGQDCWTAHGGTFLDKGLKVKALLPAQMILICALAA
ncbi:hypothetical protein Nmel_014698, partial [Mimus melanotis]